MRPIPWKQLLALALLGALLTACGQGVGVALPTVQPAQPTLPPAQPTAQPTAQPAQPTAQPAQPTLQPAPGQQPTAPQPAARPTFAFDPQGGGPGTAVTVRGWGFQPGGWVGVYLGVPGPVGTAMASAQADAQGRWALRVTIPDNLPDGSPVPAGKVHLVTMNERFEAQASAPFGFVPPAQPPTQQPAPQLPPLRQARDNVETMIVAYGTAPIQRYMARAMRDRYTGGTGFASLMGFDPLQMQGAPQVGEPQLHGQFARVPVALPFANEREHFLIELVVEDGEWRVATSAFQRAEPITRPVDRTPAAEPGSLDAEAIGRMICEHMGALRPGQPILAAAVATAGDYALGIARPQGEQMDTFFYLKRENGVWRQLLVTGPTTTDVLVNNGIPVSLEVPQPMFGIMMATFGHFNGGPGGTADGHVLINSIADGHARVTVRDAAQSDITVYLRQDGVWTALISGQVFAPEALDELGIPLSVR
ncbi:MAG TPA: hypothetical protein PKD53_09550 [Chloroflexaceae bacterium]|nr:hypothetical protein [Chloroflexaceae bacterium]